jgi:superfamily II DNA or RNA helicase
MKPLRTQHQEEGIDWLQKTGRALLGDDPGTGKTRQLIEAADGGRTLVVAPAMVIAGGTWETELQKWAAHPEKFSVVPYSMLNQRKRTTGSGTAPVRALRVEHKGRWDTLIVDEAHYIKGRSTHWTWATLEIAKQADQAFAATGTPIPGWAHELFTILQLIHGGGRGTQYGSFWRWAEQWFECKPTRFSAGAPVAGELLACGGTRSDCLRFDPTTPCEHYREFARANLGDAYLRRTRDQCIDLPPTTDTTIQVPLSPDARRAYNELKRDFTTQVDGNDVISWTGGSRIQKLELLTVSPWFLGRGDKKPTGGKLDRLSFDLSLRTRPTLVFGHRRAVVEACSRVAADLGLSSAYIHGGVPTSLAGDILRRWRNGELDVLVGSISSIGTGLQLTEADCVIFVQETYSPDKNEQALRRVHRMGQTRPVEILRYYAPNTLDANRSKLLRIKIDRQIRHLTAANIKDVL